MDDRATREAAADLIDGAIDVIHERGWCQNALTDEAGRVCIVQAFELAGDRWLDAFAAVGKEAGRHAIAFNNDPATTVEDVLLTMKRASHSLREVTA